jgi:hypothetical protein
MKRNMKHYIEENNYFYIGGRMNRRKNGKGKVGTCQQRYLSSRLGNIRHTEKDFKVLCYLYLPNINKSRLEALESEVKANLAMIYQHVGNDHFEFQMNDAKQDYFIFSLIALGFAVKYCQDHNMAYEVF